MYILWVPGTFLPASCQGLTAGEGRVKIKDVGGGQILQIKVVRSAVFLVVQGTFLSDVFVKDSLLVRKL